MSLFELTPCDAPLVISVPHDGALIPAEIEATMNPAVLGSSDRDYRISEVFDLINLPHAKIKANYSRHVIDLNRPATGAALYDNQAETELCPTTTFDYQPIYQAGMQPYEAEIKRRIDRYWRPYHQQLQHMLQAAKSRFGYCLLIDAHSIDDQVPRFFDGRLPDINVGTFGSQSCAKQLEQALSNHLQQQQTFSHVFNGRFKGGHITRYYGQPAQGIHAIQLEHAKSAYLDDQGQLSPQGNKLRQFWSTVLADVSQNHYFC